MHRLHAFSGLPTLAIVGLLLGSVLTGVLLAYGLGFLSLSPNQENVPFNTILYGQGAEGYTQPANLAIDDPGNWSKVFSQAFQANCSSPCAPPQVNFTSRTVIAVFLGREPNGGYGIKIQQIARAGSSLIVRVSVADPHVVEPGGKLCQYPEILVYPFEIVDIPKMDLRPTFITQTVGSCQ